MTNRSTISAALIVSGLAIALSSLLLGLPSLRAQEDAAGWSAKVVSQGQMLETQGWLFDFFGGRREGSQPTPQNGPEPVERHSDGTRGTVCVRLCDGFFWPVSQTSSGKRLSQAVKQCEQACPGRARLFFRNTGAEPGEMVDLGGRPYSELDNAFRHQREYVADCTCRGNPWDQEALARHRAYAVAPQSQTKAAAKSEVVEKTQTATAKRQSSPAQQWARYREQGDD